VKDIQVPSFEASLISPPPGHDEEGNCGISSNQGAADEDAGKLMTSDGEDEGDDDISETCENDDYLRSLDELEEEEGNVDDSTLVGKRCQESSFVDDEKSEPNTPVEDAEVMMEDRDHEEENK
jgi:hypothetical protein